MQFKCDRCGEVIDGYEDDKFTSGFYYVHEGLWAMYGNPYETVLCDECMFKDPRYIAVYGKR